MAVLRLKEPTTIQEVLYEFLTLEYLEKAKTSIIYCNNESVLQNETSYSLKKILDFYITWSRTVHIAPWSIIYDDIMKFENYPKDKNLINNLKEIIRPKYLGTEPYLLKVTPQQDIKSLPFYDRILAYTYEPMKYTKEQLIQSCTQPEQQQQPGIYLIKTENENPDLKLKVHIDKTFAYVYY
ncbi:MAG: hypothetical protein J5I47_08915 [Vicingus serpentipes]|nr:hypothetical protein [Vicingus serpentipes]